MSLIINLADAVVTELNTAPPGTFSLPFTATRRVVADFTLTDLATLQVTVVPHRLTMTALTRSQTQHDLSVDIGIQQKVPPGTEVDTWVTDLLTVVEEIIVYLDRHPLTQMPKTLWMQTQNDPVYIPDHLTHQRVLTSVLTVDYRSCD